ncbi:MAG TPA: M28 family peptidase [Candidatus Eremiobacteraceae bacterium]|nr:M28 family peptidase [Candidatus Eremiobacteraceae bacterium]
MRRCTAAVTVIATLFLGSHILLVKQLAAQKSLTASPPPLPAVVSDPATQRSIPVFDGNRAYLHVQHLVAIGPRPPASAGIHAAQTYIVSQLKSFGCPVDERDFHAPSPVGDLALKNITAKIPGASPNIILFATHYDTLRMANFVGADDGGSGVGTMLELARILCARKNRLNVWIAFFDGEEAQGHWTDKISVQWTASNSTFGSREMAATLALSGELKHVKAMILADMIGAPNLKIKRETNSTPWLMETVWAAASRLGYANIFVNENYPVSGDDHFSFLRRGVPAYDIIDFDAITTYWHTPQDTLDKVNPRSLAIVGNVLLETLRALEKKFTKQIPSLL